MPRFPPLKTVGSSLYLCSKCSEKYRDYFEHRLYDDPTTPMALKTAFNSREIRDIFVPRLDTFFIVNPLIVMNFT